MLSYKLKPISLDYEISKCAFNLLEVELRSSKFCGHHGIKLRIKTLGLFQVLSVPYVLNLPSVEIDENLLVQNICDLIYEKMTIFLSIKTLAPRRLPALKF